MPSSTASHLSRALDDMRAEYQLLAKRASKLQTAIAAAEEYVGTPRPVKRSIPARQNGRSAAKPKRAPVSAAVKPQQPAIDAAIVTVIREGGKRSWSAADLTSALSKRGIVKAADGPQATEKVRKALSRLRRKGVLVGKRDGEGQWAPTIWTLAN